MVFQIPFEKVFSEVVLICADQRNQTEWFSVTQKLSGIFSNDFEYFR